MCGLLRGGVSGSPVASGWKEVLSIPDFGGRMIIENEGIVFFSWESIVDTECYLSI